MKNTKRPRRQWSDEEKQAIVREYRKSDDSISGFARRRDVGLSSLRSWIETIGEDPSVGAAFVELTTMLPREEAGGEYHYELSLRSGHTLRLRRGFDSREAAALAEALTDNA